MSSWTNPTAPTPRSSPTRRRTRPSRKRRAREAAPVPGAREQARHVTAPARQGSRSWPRRSRSPKRRAAAPRPIPMSAASSSPTARSSAAARPRRAAGPMPRRWRLTQAGEKARGATLYVTLEPCAHCSERGPTCSAIIAEARHRAGSSPRSRIPTRAPPGKGFRGLREAGVEVKVGVGRRGGAGEHGRLADPPGARPAAHHAQAGPVDRRQDRACRRANRNGSPARMRAPTSISNAPTAT